MNAGPRGRAPRRAAARGSVRAAAAGAVAAAAARAAYAALRARPPGGEKTWNRTNHRGEPVTLLEGPAVAAGAVIGAAVAPGTPARVRAAAALAGTAAAAFGALDDLAAAPGEPKGFRGHLGALRRGQVTTGAVKLGGIGLTGIAAGTALGGSPADAAVNAALIAGGANLLNLFDLRPGRAVKVAALAGAALSGAAPAAAPLAAAPAAGALALAGPDLGERAMLGDAGANALGAMLGAAAAAGLSRKSRIAVVAVITGLTAASEVVSFTRVIEKTPPLRWLDMLGRRPAPPAAQPPDAQPPDGQPPDGQRAGDSPAAGPLAGGRAWSGRSQTSA